jgi:hypothetical protein
MSVKIGNPADFLTLWPKTTLSNCIVLWQVVEVAIYVRSNVVWYGQNPPDLVFTPTVYCQLR